MAVLVYGIKTEVWREDKKEKDRRRMKRTEEERLTGRITRKKREED